MAAEVVAISVSWPRPTPPAYLPNLAMSLNNLANLLSEVGRRDEALAGLATEAVTLRRKLAEASPAAYLPNLAMSMNNLANWLSGVDRRDEALEVAAEAVTLSPIAGRGQPHRLPPQSRHVIEQPGHPLERHRPARRALDVAAESVAHYRELPSPDPAAYLFPGHVVEQSCHPLGRGGPARRGREPVQ